MKMLKKILLVIVVLVVILQFIRPPRNVSEADSVNDISTKFIVPQVVHEMLHTACYNCHSNNTRYPWYAAIQPVGWFLNSHIQDAKKDLNFSEFTGYRLRRQFIKLQQIAEQVSEEEMPLPSYLLLHVEARLSKEQRERIVGWANSARDSMKALYPPDSLERKGR